MPVPPDKTRNTIDEVIRQYVRPMSIIWIDKLKSYAFLGQGQGCFLSRKSINTISWELPDGWLIIDLIPVVHKAKYRRSIARNIVIATNSDELAALRKQCSLDQNIVSIPPAINLSATTSVNKIACHFVWAIEEPCSYD